MHTRVTGTTRFVTAITAVVAAIAFLVVTSPVPPVGAETAAAPVGAVAGERYPAAQTAMLDSER